MRVLGGGWLAGGSPWRLLRVSAEGEALETAWSDGRPVDADPRAAELAARLADAGLLLVEPDPDPDADLTVVVPVHQDPVGLAATLAPLLPTTDVVVVDDASTPPVTPPVGARLIRCHRQGGPGAARNTGWRAATGALVAFVDADCVLSPGSLARLAGHFADPAVAAVAPRVLAVTRTPTPAWLGAYELHRSPLDLGRRGGPVRPGATVSYLPSAALVVRREALEAVGGFDEALRTGEDVDLVWRLSRAGWRVRYDPHVRALHPPRTSAGAALRQRYGYGRSAAPLAARHGANVAPLVLSPWSAAALGLAAAGRPVAAGAVVATTLARLVQRRPEGVSPGVLLRAGALGQLRSARATAEALRRTWWPLTLLAALCSRRARRVALVAALVEPVVTWERRRPGIGLVRWVAAWLADDVAYGAGVWAGALRQRSTACLRPARPPGQTAPR